MPSPLAEPLPWDLVSRDYAADVVPLFEGYARRAWSLAGVGPGARVADVACGPGTLAACAVAEGAEVDALDFAPAMVAALEARGLPRVRAVIGDGQMLPWADASFDAAFSMFGLMFFPDRIRGLRELARVVVPGGRVVVSSWHPPSAVPQLVAMYAAMMPPGAPAPSAPPELPLTRAEDHAREMGEAGLVDVAVVTHVEAITRPTMGELFAGFLRTNAPMCLLRQRVGDVAFAELATHGRDALVAQFGDGPQEVPMPAWIAVARTAA
jgi:SAM-dependent methyltransferase